MKKWNSVLIPGALLVSFLVAGNVLFPQIPTGSEISSGPVTQLPVEPLEGNARESRWLRVREIFQPFMVRTVETPMEQPPEPIVEPVPAPARVVGAPLQPEPVPEPSKTNPPRVRSMEKTVPKRLSPKPRRLPVVSGIMFSPNDDHVAIISGQIVREGGTVEGYAVKKIGRNFVLLKSGDEELRLYVTP